MKLNINAELAAKLLPFAQTIVEGNGKLWDASRNAFLLALTNGFPQPKDAAQAVRQVIEDELKANPGSAKSYLSTLVWLASEKDAKGNKAGGLNAEAIGKLSMQDATDLRYPKQPKLAADDFDGKIQRLTERKAKSDAAKAERDKAEAEANAKDPRRAILSQIATALAPLDLTALELVAVAVLEAVEAIKASDKEADAGQRTGTEG